MPQALLNELTDRIIDHCRDSRPTLLACRLVSTTWRSAAELHLFTQSDLPHVVRDGQEGIVKHLLHREDTMADTTDWFGRTALSFAAAQGNDEVVALLLPAGV